jgi:hypothetical protein
MNYSNDFSEQATQTQSDIDNILIDCINTPKFDLENLKDYSEFLEPNPRIIYELELKRKQEEEEHQRKLEYEAEQKRIQEKRERLKKIELKAEQKKKAELLKIEQRQKDRRKEIVGVLIFLIMSLITIIFMVIFFSNR